MHSPATSFMREIEGAAAMIDGDAKRISGIRVLGRYRLQVRLTKPVGDLTARLTMPFFCPILPNTPIEPQGIDNTPGSGPYYIAERIVNQRIVLRRNTYYRGNRPANVDQVIWTIGETRENCLAAVESDRIDHCVHFSIPTTACRGLAEEHGINRPRGQLVVAPGLTTWFLAFNHDRPAFGGPVRSRSRRQLLPAALARTASIYPLDGAKPRAARRWYARSRFRPTRLVLYSSNSPVAVVQSKALSFDLARVGIDLEVRCFDAQSPGYDPEVGCPGPRPEARSRNSSARDAAPSSSARAAARARYSRALSGSPLCAW
jgi:MarR-like DNA-binding transcriptional regulator SgrR of sgrS sRNA